MASTRADIVIVGGGIQGLLLAFNLADRGQSNIILLDAAHWQSGASGRNGTLVRDGFSSMEWTQFFHHSVNEWKRLSKRLGHNVMYTRRGYVLVSESENSQSVFDIAEHTHRDCDVKSERLSRARMKEVLPAADQGRIVDMIHLADGGTAPHHAAMKAALAACRKKDVDVRYGTRVTDFERQNGRISAVYCGDLRIDAGLVVIAAGAHSTDLAAKAGVELDAEPFRIEIMASEPVRPLITPAVALIDRLTYLHQTTRGEIVGGSELAGESGKRNLVSTEYVMPRYARHMVEMFPQTADMRILRQWSGMIHPAPDGGPLLGPHPDVDSLWFSAGWTYGIAGAPGTADLLSKAIISGEIDERMKPFAIDRFRRGQPVVEASAVIDNASA